MMKIILALILFHGIFQSANSVESRKQTFTVDHVVRRLSNRQSFLQGQKELEEMTRNLRKIYNLPEIQKILSNIEETKDFLFSANVTEECTTSLIFALTNRTAWSSAIFDSLGKIPASILLGAQHWTVGYEQCIGNQPPPNYPGGGPGPGTHYVRAGIYTPYTIQSTLVTVDLGMCVPDTCTDIDLYVMFYKVIEIATAVSPEVGKFRVVLGTQPKEPTAFSSAAIAMIVVSSLFGLVMIIGTVYDLLKVQKVGFLRRSGSIQFKTKGAPDLIGNEIMSEEIERVADTEDLITEDDESAEKAVEVRMKSLSGWEKAIVAFSMYTNTMKIIETKQQPGRLNCLDGIRFLSMTWVILGHTVAFALGYVNNPVNAFELIFKHWTYAPMYNAFYSVDSFFVLSGLLTAYLFLKETQRNGVNRIKFWILYYLHRFWRLTPPMMLFLGFYTSLTVYMSNGPFWTVSTSDRDNCEKYWWRNLLYIQNLFDIQKACMGHTWYLANDMQFHYLLAPGILIGMHFLGLWGMLLTCPLILVSMLSSGIIAHNEGQPKVNVLMGSDNIYYKPWCRVGAYAVGLAVGGLLYEFKKKNRKLHVGVVFAGWTLSAVFFITTVYGICGIISGSYTISDEVLAFYISQHRVVWSLALSWLIFACLTGNGGWINSFLSWKPFIPLSRLTYSAYLVHPLVIYVVYMSFQQAALPTTVTIVYWFIGHVVISYMVAFILCITCESPLIGLERILLKKQ